MWTVYEMASFGWVLGIFLPTLGCQPEALRRIVATTTGRAWRAHFVVFFVLFSLILCCACNSSNSFTTTEEKEIDHGAKDNLYFLAFDDETVLKSNGGTYDGPRDGFWWRCVAHRAMLRRLRSASYRLSLDLAGRDFPEYLMNILTERRYLSWPPRVGDRSWCQKEI